MKRGMTLIEIVVVLSILGVVAAVTVPALRDVGSPDPAREATDAVAHILNRARITARTAGYRVTVTIDPATQRYWIDEPPLSGAFALPRNVSLWSDRVRPRVVFEPAGSAMADAIAIQFAGRSMALTVNRFTGEVTTGGS